MSLSIRIKHGKVEDSAKKVGTPDALFDYVASMDFGSYDGSCTSEVRSIVSCIRTAHGHTGDMQDRRSPSKIARRYQREHGHRGQHEDREQSIWNYFTNVVLFLAKMSQVLRGARLQPSHDAAFATWG